MPVKKASGKTPPRRPAGRKKKAGPSGYTRTVLVFLGKAAVLGMIWGGVAIGAVVAWYAYGLPDISQITKPQRRPSITLLADNGMVFARLGDFYGQRVTGQDVPRDLVNAILAVEDRRFYSHFGVDILGLLRAFATNLMARRVVQGGSTLTQQLAKNLFLTPERTPRRKIQEMLLAFWLEKTYSKDQILSAYLNRVYLGAGAYGVDAAADVYFGKSVSALTLKESALLAGLLRAPSRFSPLNNPELAAQRAKTVLAAMQDAGYITENQKNTAFQEVAKPQRKTGQMDLGRYFADWIVDQVGPLLAGAPQDVTILTTLDMRMQREAERSMDAVLASVGPKQGAHEGALVSMTSEGAVRAMVGGRDYGQSQFNRATQARRQPGSAFKPVVYLAAIRRGLSPDDVFDDAPIKIGKWTPHNYDGQYKGPMTARQALAFSVNSVAVRVMQHVGVSAVVETAQDLGITSELEEDLSLALGTSGVSVLEMTGAYAVLASGGRAVAPFGIKEIRGRDGRVLYRREAPRLPVMVEPQAVSVLVDMLRDVVRVGTGRRAALDRPVAGKTGTSSDYRDAWFLGFTGNYVTGVWLGNDDNAPMKKVSGGSLPAGLWRDFMVAAEKDLPVLPLVDETTLVSPLLPQPSGETWSDNKPSVAKERAEDALGAFIKSLTQQDLEIDPSYP